VVYFAACKSHIGLFLPVSGDERLEMIFAPYATGPRAKAMGR
jgi:hypothetical protein